jgi:DNA segregation ATPase FtsK/SpoIIIE-like protein
MGGAKGDLAAKIVDVQRTSLKYGIHVVIAGHEFYVEEVGHIITNCVTRICHRLQTPQQSKLICGHYGATEIRIQGRAITNEWGVTQVYLTTKEQMLKCLSSPTTGMTPTEERIAKALWDEFEDKPGWMSTDRIRVVSNICSETQARRLRDDWVRRGLARHRPELNHAIYLTKRP